MLATIVLAQLMVTLDGTVVNIALPSAQRALQFSNGDRQWVVTAYLMAFGGLLLLGGRLSDLIGRKRAFLIGLTGFTVASAAGGAAQSFSMLIAARVVQGMSAALLAPTALALLITTFTEARGRARAFAVFSAAASGGAALGLLIGGVLTEDLSWRWTLYINVIIGAAALAGGTLFVKHSPGSGSRSSLDLPGAALASVGLFTLVLGLSQAQTSGWGSPACWAPLVAAAILLPAFVASERRAPQPLLPLSVAADRNRGGALIAILLTSVGMFGALLFVNYYLQAILGYTPLTTGIAFLPMVAMLILAAQLASSRLLPRLGPKIVIPTGMTIAAIGMAYLTRLGVHPNYLADVLPGLVLIGFGIGNVITSCFQTATLGIDPRLTGVASATVNASQQIGGSIGIALLNTVAITATARDATHDAHSHHFAVQAAAHGYTTAFWWAAGTYLLGALTAAAVLRRRHTQPRPPARRGAAGSSSTRTHRSCRSSARTARSPSGSPAAGDSRPLNPDEIKI